MARIFKICLAAGSLAAAVSLSSAGVASAETASFGFTGGAQSWVVPAGVTSATFDLYGASSVIFVQVRDNTYIGGIGGRARATISVVPGTSIQVNVGGAGDNQGGWNGGGDGSGSSGGSGGGGATDIRIGGTALGDRVLVAGGGGGLGICIPVFADGGEGGELGTDGEAGGCGGAGGGGGTATTGGSATSPAHEGSFGEGGDASGGTTTGGGGGGWYGGGGGLNGGGGGGGSSHGPPGTLFETGVNFAAGSAVITYEVAPPETPETPLKCFRSDVTIRGTAGADTLTGTPDRDVISGLGGKDVIRGLGGADVLCGNKGNDRIFGGEGRDVLRGGKGLDHLFGGSGQDLLNPGADGTRGPKDVLVP
jgi:Ca2+-binding RTX toxin-like protein